MRRRPVAAAIPSRSDRHAGALAALGLAALLLWPVPSLAAAAGAVPGNTSGPVPDADPAPFVEAADEVALIADVRAHTPDEVSDLLQRLETLAGSTPGFPSHDPVVMVLHGDEAATFTRVNYPQYKDTVDRAARLEAFGLLDVRVCERWMDARGVMRSDLPPFVDTVPDGVVEERRLERAGYLSF